jgi:hypothetical protein
MPSSRLGLGALFAAFVLTTAPSARAQQYVYGELTNFGKNGNTATDLQSTFPAGSFTANNAWATPFDVSTANGENYAQINTTLNVDGMGFQGPTDVFALLNYTDLSYQTAKGGVMAAAAAPTSVLTIQFLGDAGASQTFTLNDGVDIRNYYQGNSPVTLSGSTENAYSTGTNAQGAEGTGDASTGALGTYVVDEQHFALEAAFATQNLQIINITNTGSNDPIALGFTAARAVPEPTAAALLPGGLGLLALSLGRRRLSRRCSA